MGDREEQPVRVWPLRAGLGTRGGGGRDCYMLMGSRAGVWTSVNHASGFPRERGKMLAQPLR